MTISSTEWKKIQRPSENEIEKARRDRVWIERRPIRQARAEIAERLLEAFKSNLDPASASTITHPPAALLVDSAPFQDVITSEDHDDAREGDFLAAMSQVPAYYDHCVVARIAELVALLPTHADQEGMDSASRLRLATSYFLNTFVSRFEHSRNRVVFATDELKSLPRALDLEEKDGKVFRYFRTPTSLDAANDLIKLAGLDPRTATIAEMDQRDARFRCLCGPDKAPMRGCEVSLARSWRNCVSCSITH